MKTIDTREYVSMLRELTEAGHEVNMVLAGSSMSPFLVHQRDIIWFRKVDRPLKRGDMVFYQRRTGQFVMHRIYRVRDHQYYMVGDAQTVIEGPIEEDQIFARIYQVQRKGRMISEEDFWWKFFRTVWIRMVPLRPLAQRIYGMTAGHRH